MAFYEEFASCSGSSGCGGGGCGGSNPVSTSGCGGGSGCGGHSEIRSLTSRINNSERRRKAVINEVASRGISRGCGGSIETVVSIDDESGCGGGSKNIYISDSGSCGRSEVTVMVDSSCGGREPASNEDIARAFSKIRRSRR